MQKEHLTFSSHAIFMQARHSSHYIHLTESDLVYDIVEKTCKESGW